MANENNQNNNSGLMQKALNVNSSKSNGLLSKSKENNVNSKIQEQNTIVLKDGIFSIQENLVTTGVQQDPELKALVDSVIH